MEEHSIHLVKVKIEKDDNTIKYIKMIPRLK